MVLECEGGFVSASGAAGNGGELFANDGNDGMVAPEPNPAGYGEGGKGESADGSQLCTPGYGGVQGADGEDGMGALWSRPTDASGLRRAWLERSTGACPVKEAVAVAVHVAMPPVVRRLTAARAGGPAAPAVAAGVPAWAGKRAAPASVLRC